MLTAFVGQAILLEASLSYLGLGVQEPTPAWGLMLRSSQEFMREEAFLAIIQVWQSLWLSLGSTCSEMPSATS